MNILSTLFDEWASWYLFFTNHVIKILDQYISQDTIKIKQILLHLKEGQKIDISSYIHDQKLQYPDLDSFLEQKQKTFQEIKMDSIEELHLEIVYHQGEDKYRIMYNQGDKIDFPLYPPEEVISHQLIDNYQNGVLFATYHDQDVTDLLKEYAGPKGNFYQDKDIYITLDKIKYGLHVYRDKDDPKHELIITDNYAQDHTFQEGDKLIL